MRFNSLLSLVASGLLLASNPADAQLETIELTFEGVAVSLEVALTSEQHAKGLSDRERIPDATGMVFDFHPARQVCFWMRNTLVALDAVFVSADGRVRLVAQMQPRSLEQHCTAEKIRWVLEFPTDWTERAGLDLRGAQVSDANLTKLRQIR